MHSKPLRAYPTLGDSRSKEGDPLIATMIADQLERIAGTLATNRASHVILGGTSQPHQPATRKR